MNIHKIIATLI